MAGGAHFFTDVVFAGVVMFLVVWTLHGLIYRWRATRVADEVIDQRLARAGETLRGALMVLIRLGRADDTNPGG
jgi:membrane-associated phospholipid phosphatase